jgi:hypothetical protein
MHSHSDGKLETLSRLEIGHGLTHRALLELARAFDLSTGAPGARLSAPRRPDCTWALMIEGAAITSRDGRPERLLRSGDSFGALPGGGALGEESVVALTPVVLLTTDRRGLGELARCHPFVRSALDVQVARSMLPGPVRSAAVVAAA